MCAHIFKIVQRKRARARVRETEAERDKERGREGWRKSKGGRERPMCVHVRGKEGERETEMETHVSAG